jgi:hypothetical protein
MAVKIRNLTTSGPILVPLSSGTTVRLSPGQSSGEMPDVEVTDNAKVDKLRRQGLIDIEPTETDESEAAAESGTPPDAPGESDSKPRSPSRKRTDSSG